MSASSPGSDGGGMSIREDPGSSPDIRPAPGHRAENAGLLGSAGLPTVGRIRPEGPSCNPTPAWRLEWSAAPARVTALRWRDGGGAVSRPQGWSSLRNSRLLHVTAGRPPGGKRPVFATGEASCDPLAKKVVFDHDHLRLHPNQPGPRRGAAPGSGQRLPGNR